MEETLLGNHVCVLESGRSFAVQQKSRICISKLTKHIYISPANPLTKFFFRSNAAIEAEIFRHKSNYRCVIHPYSQFRWYYELCFIVFYIIDLVMSPFHIIFCPNVSTVNFVDTVIASLEHGDFMVALLNLVDLSLTFFTGQIVLNKKYIILNHSRIAQEYLKSKSFYFDLYFSIPHYIKTYGVFLLFPSWYTQDYPIICLVLDLVQLMKIFRLIRLAVYWRNVFLKFRHDYYLTLFLKYLLVIIIIMDYLTILHFTIGSFTSQKHSIYSYTRQTQFTYNYPTVDAYCALFYRISSHVLSVSLVNGQRTSKFFLPERTDEMCLFIFNSLLGFVGTNLALIIIIQLVLTMNSTEIKYYAIISQLNKYMFHQDLPSSMQKRILTYYEYRFQKKYFREMGIMNMLSETLRREINMHCCRTLIDNVSLLRELPSDVLAEIVVNLKQEVFLHNDVIFKADSVGDCMYFISKGTVAIYTKNGKEICHLQDGAYFGEVALIAKEPLRVADVVAIEICEIYRLDKYYFRTCFPPLSLYYKKIQQIAQERLEKTALLEELHRKYLIENKTKHQAEQTTRALKDLF